MSDTWRNRQDRSARIRALPATTEPASLTPAEIAALLTDLRKSKFVRLFMTLPGWGRVLVVAAVTVGAGTGGAFAAGAKLLHLQTLESAASDKAELMAKLEAVVKAQQTADDIAAKRDAETSTILKAIQAEQISQSAKLATIGRRLPKRASASTPKDETQ